MRKSLSCIVKKKKKGCQWMWAVSSQMYLAKQNSSMYIWILQETRYWQTEQECHSWKILKSNKKILMEARLWQNAYDALSWTTQLNCQEHKVPHKDKVDIMLWGSNLRPFLVGWPLLHLLHPATANVICALNIVTWHLARHFLLNY